MQAKVRLNRYIASTGAAPSRRSADKLIEEGRVKVNGNLVTEPGMSVTNRDTVEIDGRKIRIQEKKYAIFYKPPGYITTKKDPGERKTIYDILPPSMQNLKSAGRLDKDSSGLLILTNDGELIQKLIHPKGQVPKIYKVTVEGRVTQQDLNTLEQGIEIEKGKIARAYTAMLDYEKGITTLEITLYQGYYRQIRRMLQTIGHPVISLKRIVHANITLSGLDKGKARFLSRKEVENLYNYLKNLEKKAKA